MSQPVQVSEPFGNIPDTAETFGTIPYAADDFRTLPKGVERKESHTLTVREVARMFESAGVARTERSIINWCQPNKLGVSRLAAYFDPNEHRYFITAQSVELAIKEEQAKAAKSGSSSEPVGTIPQHLETHSKTLSLQRDREVDGDEALRQEIMDLKITNLGKDWLIGQLRKEQEGFALERKDYVEKLINSHRQIGELETRLLQLGAPGGAGTDEAVLKE